MSSFRGQIWKRLHSPCEPQGYSPNLCSEGTEPTLPGTVLCFSALTHVSRFSLNVQSPVLECSEDPALALARSTEPDTQPWTASLPSYVTLGKDFMSLSFLLCKNGNVRVS